MKLRFLCTVILAGLVLEPAAAETLKAKAPPVAKKPAAKVLGAPAAPATTTKKANIPVKAGRAASAPAPAAKPAPPAKKTLSLKALFSRKTTAKPPPVPVPAPVAAAKPPAPKLKATRAKRGPVIPPDPGENIDISFPEPKGKKSSVASADSSPR